MHRRLISPSIPRSYARATLLALAACCAVVAGAAGAEGTALADEPGASGAGAAPATGVTGVTGVAGAAGAAGTAGTAGTTATAGGEADTGAAKAAFQEGSRAYGAGDYRHAAESFEAAYKLNPHPSALWNAARARQRAGDIAKARTRR